MVLKALPDSKDHKAWLVTLEFRAVKEMSELTGFRALSVPKESLVLREIVGSKASLGHKDSKDLSGKMELKDSEDPKVCKASEDCKGFVDYKAIKGFVGCKET